MPQCATTPHTCPCHGTPPSSWQAQAPPPFPAPCACITCSTVCRSTAAHASLMVLASSSPPAVSAAAAAVEAAVGSRQAAADEADVDTRRAHSLATRCCITRSPTPVTLHATAGLRGEGGESACSRAGHTRSVLVWHQCCSVATFARRGTSPCANVSLRQGPALLHPSAAAPHLPPVASCAQQPAPNTAASPTRPSDLRAMPPLLTPAATRPLPSTTTTPTVS